MTCRSFPLIVLLLGLLACGKSPLEGLTPQPGPTQEEEEAEEEEQNPPERCGPSTFVFDVQIMTVEARQDWDSTSPIAAPGGVYVSRQGTSYSNAPDDYEVVRIDLLTNDERQITQNNVDDFVVAVQDDAFLYRRDSGAGRGGRTDLFYGDSGNEILLAEDALAQVGYDFDNSGRQARMVGRYRAAWVDGTDGSIQYFSGLEVNTVSAGLVNNSAPDAAGNMVTWTAFDGNDTEVYLFRVQETIRITDNDLGDSWPVIAASNVYWVSAGSLMVRKHRTGEHRVLHEGPCGPPVAHGIQVVFACLEEGDPDAWPMPYDALFVTDGENVERLETNGGIVFAPRIYENRVAWIEYDDPDALCQGAFGDGGAVYFMDLDALEPKPIEVDRIGAPCLCCGAYWPPARLSFSRDVLVWNYGASGEVEEGEPPYFGNGAALITTHRDCE